MKPALWSLLLLVCLSSPGQCDCQGDCLACALLPPPNLQMQGQQQRFNTLVCLLECEGHFASGLPWDLCQQATQLHYGLLPEGVALSRRAESLDTVPGEQQSGGELLYSAAMERYQQDAEGPDDGAMEQRDSQYITQLLGSQENGDSLGLEDWEGEEGGQRKRSLLEGGSEEEEDEEAMAQLTKRFGGFLKGRHGYRKLVSGTMGRPLQKRLGGFIGIRKSARKWNNQKRVSQLLRQYLEMTSSRTSGRAGRFTNPGAGPKRQRKRL